MSKVKNMRDFVNQRLAAAAEEIFEVFERTIAEYEEELFRSKEKQRKILNTIFNPEVQLHREDVQHVLMRKDEVRSEQHEGNPILNQEDLQEPPNIKEEQEELWIYEEGEQLQRSENADLTKLTFTSVPVKPEEDEENPQSSQLHHRKTGEPEPARIYIQGRDLMPCIQYPTSRSPECQINDSHCVWDEISDSHSGLNLMKTNEINANYTGNGSVSAECAAIFAQKEQPPKHNGIKKELKPFRCSICGKRFAERISLKEHRSLHSDHKRFSCSICRKKFHWRKDILTHMRTHTGEKPFHCSYCSAQFTQSSNLTSHLKVHTRERPFSCSVCQASFSIKKSLVEHRRIHTGEKPFNCSLCGKRFAQKGHMRRHLSVHTGEKPFVCSVCGKGFSQNVGLKKHSMIHTGEKPFSCNMCNKRFSRLDYVKNHRCLGEGGRKQ